MRPPIPTPPPIIQPPRPPRPPKPPFNPLNVILVIVLLVLFAPCLLGILFVWSPFHF